MAIEKGIQDYSSQIPVFDPDTLTRGEYYRYRDGTIIAPEEGAKPEQTGVKQPGLDVVISDVYWQNKGECNGLSPDMFFPEKMDKAGTAAAKAVCKSCIVQEVCLEDVLSKPKSDVQGVRAGMSGKELRKLKRERRRLAN